MRSGASCLLTAIAIAGCSSDPGPRTPAADAGPDDASSAEAGPEPDAGRAAWQCGCEPDEDCDACVRKIGECCYEDPTITGEGERIAGTCARDGACAACCDECAAKSCEELIAAGACPPQPQVPWGNGVVLGNGVLQDLAGAALSTESLAGQESLAPLLDDPGFHKFVAYLVQCALPEGAEVQVGDETLPGAIGLAPEWADGPCEEACQEWVSACMLGRSNTYGVTVELYATSTNGASQIDEDDASRFPEQEGAFYGNLFLDPPVEYGCRGDGRDPLLGTFRVCAQPGNRCGIQHVGACGPIDGATGEPSTRHACEEFDPVARAYTRCHDRASEPGSDAFPEGTKVYERVVTTWVARTAFQEGYADACESQAIEPFAPDDVPGPAGATCDNDDDCDTSLGLHCDARPDRGFCTMACTDSADPGAEQAQCGPDSTCLTQSGTEGVCTAACAPHTRGGDCATGQLCSSLWLFRATPDQPGCRPFCSSDADCPPETPCDRFGACGFTVDLAALADGEPCTFPEGSDYPVVPCRGACIRIDQDPSHGLCASLLDRTVTDHCPDDRQMPIITGDDDLGVCMYRRCTVDDDCSAPLVCTDTARGGLCDYAR